MSQPSGKRPLRSAAGRIGDATVLGQIVPFAAAFIAS